jgi:lysine 2,3-aminomutase
MWTFLSKVFGNGKIPSEAEKVLASLLAEDGSHLTSNLQMYLENLWQSNQKIHELLQQAPNVEQARAALLHYLQQVEHMLLDPQLDTHLLVRASIRESVFVFRNILSKHTEQLTEVSALEYLWQLAQEGLETLSEELSPGFFMEFIYLFRQIAGRANIYHEEDDFPDAVPDFLQQQGRQAAQARTEVLDAMASAMDYFMRRYPSGLEPSVVLRRQGHRQRILEALGGTEEDWHDAQWHLQHIITDPQRLTELIELEEKERSAIEQCADNRIPFGITPFYLSLIDQEPNVGLDRAIRAQVIPSLQYVKIMRESKDRRPEALDFMGEADTSPIELVSRRYPGIAILKPYNACSQICVYCQRNWEIEECMAQNALAAERLIDQALDWISVHPAIGDILVTGGDPMVMPLASLEKLLARLSAMPHVYRIRIGTRTIVVLPQRWTDEVTDTIARFHEPGRREMAIVTHFEHPYEITPEALQAVIKIKRRGMSVYNQQVFTVETSRRFETAKLRKVLRSIGIDPYYTFNMKGKEETRQFMAPIARLLQERKEEARLLPGLDRTDEPVFNVPRLGKNHMLLSQDHRLLTIRPDGRRIYSFHPWEKNIALIPPYFYTDVSIFDYLQELAARGENLQHYRTIWFYY